MEKQAPSQIVNTLEKLEFPRLRWIVFCLVFYAFPIIFAAFVFQDTCNQRQALLEKKLELQLERVLDQFARFADPENFSRSILLGLMKKVLPPNGKLEDIPRWVARINRRFPGVFQFVFLNGEGNILAEYCSKPSPKTFLKKFFHASREFINGNQELIKNNWKLFRSFLGPQFQLRRFKDFECLIPAFYGSEKAFVLLSKPRPEGMMIAFVNRTSNWSSLGVEDQITFFNNKAKNFKVFLIDVSKPPGSYEAISREFGCDFSSIMGKFEVSSKTVFPAGNFLWSQSMISPILRMIAVSPIPSDLEISRWRWRFVLSTTLLFGILSVATWLIMSKKWNIFLSIKVKLAFLFIFTMGLPISVIFANSKKYLE